MRTFHVRTWGCQTNYTDTEKIVALLEMGGLERVSDMARADVLVLNTCSVRQRAEDKVLGMARKIRTLRQKNVNLIVVLTGCMAGRVKRDGAAQTVDVQFLQGLKRRLPWVDHIIPIGSFQRLVDVLGLQVSPPEYLSAPQVHADMLMAAVPISEGCDNFCSYCVVPYTRGKEVSRPRGEILCQIKELLAGGTKLVTLLGQNVNSWQGEGGFPGLITDSAQLTGEFWLTFLTAHPKDLTYAVVQAMAENRKICPYINLPTQSGSSRVLSLMNRKYTIEQYVEKVNMLRDSIPHIRLSTDIIVGFPGETDDDFDQTLALLDKIRFGMVYIAEYSPRAGTAGYLLKDTVSVEEKKRRREAVELLQRRIMEENNGAMVGTVVDVLVISDCLGKTHDLRDVRFDRTMAADRGQVVKVRITGSSASGFTGERAV